MVEHIETPTGTYEVRHNKSEAWVVWSTRNKAPVGVYPTLEEARASLNTIRMGERPPGQPDDFESMEDIVETAALLTDQWAETDPTWHPMARLMQAALDADDIEEVKTLVALAYAGWRFENRGN